VIPGKNSDTRIKPLSLTNGHGRYIAVSPERTLFFRWGMAVTHNSYKFVIVAVTCNGRFTFETATWIQKWLKMSVGTSKWL
jgi:hypothetical protein